MLLDKIKDLFNKEQLPENELIVAINEMDPFEIARLLHQLSAPVKLQIFNLLNTTQKQQELVYETDRDSRDEIIVSLGSEALATLLGGMEEDEATDILKEQREGVQDDVLGKMWPNDADTIKNLIRFDEETAGGMMIPDYPRISPEQTAAQILMKIKRETKDQISYFYVVDSQNKLAGFFKLRDLLNVSPNTMARDLIRKKNPKVLLEDPCEKVAALMDNDHLSSLPVVDEENIMQGIITFDDVLRVTQEVASEEIYTMVGTPKEDPFAQRLVKKLLARIPWILPTFLGGVLSALILGYFQINMVEFATVIFFIPFVLGLAGNVGIQGATVIVRGMATGDIQSDNLNSVMRSEISVGCLMGIIFGVLGGVAIALIARNLLNSTPLLGLAVGGGIVFAVASAALFGSLIPVLLVNLKIDPAISTGPLITVINDVLGLLIYMLIIMLTLHIF